jgi:hypothetical protein
MPPALVLMRVGRARRLTLPLPFFLLWPLVLLAWVGLGLAWLVTAWRRPAPLVAGITALRAINELRGTRIDIRSRDASVHLQFI